MAKKYQDKVGASETPNTSSEESEVRSWLRTISSTEKWRDQEGDKAGWKNYIKHYKGDWGDITKSVNIPIIPLNFIYAYTKTEIARMYFRDPWITVNPKRIEDIGASQIAEQIVNYTWTELSLKTEIKRTLLEAILVGHSYIKVGYVAEFGTAESQPKDEPRKPGRPPKKNREVETSEFIKSENVFAYHVPYKDIIFDPSATFPAPHNARWMAQKIVKPLRAVKESGIYNHTEDLKPTGWQKDPNSPFDISEGTEKDLSGKDIKSVTLWEVYDLDNMKVLTVSPGCPYYLNEMDYPEYLVGGFPFVQLAFNPVPGDVFPLSDVATQEGLCVEMTKIVAMWMNHLKRHSSRQIIVEPDLFTPEEESKFKDSVDGAIIKANGPIADKYFLPQYPAIQADAYQVYNEVYKTYQIVSGQTPADQGGQAKVPTRTLGELRLQLQGGHARADEKVDVLEDFITEVAKKLLGIMQKKYDLPKIARIVGPESVKRKILGILPQRPSAQPQIQGQPNPLAGPGGGTPPQPMQGQPQQNGSIYTSDFSFSWNRQDILGEMDVDVVAGSTVPMDRESQLQILEKMIPLLPAAGITPGSPAAKAYAREVLRLINIQSLEAIMDLAEQTPPQMPPQVQLKAMETQAKVKAKEAETQIKIQGKIAEEKIKLAAMAQKMEIDKQKAGVDMHKNVINTILQGVRSAQAPVQENGNGF